MSDWCILRTSGRHTLSLAESLCRGGFDVWTPAHILRRRVPRKKAREEISAPLLPTYVFARSSHLANLIDLTHLQAKEYPDFSVFHYLGRIPLIADDELMALRTSEARSTQRKRQRQFLSGETVRIHEGGFAGMSGIVEEDRGKYALVCFGRTTVKIAAFLLHTEARQAA